MGPMRKTAFACSWLAAGALLLSGAPAAAQNVLLDEGAFTIYLGDREVGRETFTIRRMGSGADARIIANAVVDVDARQIRPLLETTPDFGLTAYEVKISGREETEIAVQLTGRRFVARVRSAAGEQEREFRAREDAVLLEENVAHQYYFLTSAADEEGATLAVIVPGATEMADLAVRSVARVSLPIGGETLEARRVTLVVDGVERSVWVDARGRVLRVEIPSTGYRAERVAPPA